MKVVIPAAGVGTRLRPHTHAIPKILMRTAGKTILEHILYDIIKLNPDEIIFIIGYLGDEIRDFITRKYKHIKTSFIVQEEYNGLGAAISLSAPRVSDEDNILIILGDTLIRTDLNKFLKSGDNVIAVKEVEDPRKFGVIETSGKKITKLIEKPENPPTNLAVVGLYYIKKAGKLYASLNHIMTKGIKTKNEYQLTDALQHMLENGDEFNYFTIDKWLDCGNKTNILETNKELLSETGSYIKTEPENSVIIDPVYIEEGTEIVNSVVGPYVSVGKGSLVKDAVIKDTIIGENSEVENIVLSNSLISDNVVVNDAAKVVNIGSHCELKF
jgi:glucose-1-phosphate thymidylyltransferase